MEDEDLKDALEKNHELSILFKDKINKLLWEVRGMMIGVGVLILVCFTTILYIIYG